MAFAPGRDGPPGQNGPTIATRKERRMDMGRLVPTAVLALGMLLGAVGLAVAQDTPATPPAGTDFCASPEATPGEATPAQQDTGTPGIDTSGTPSAVATEIVENIAGGLDVQSCGTPDATPGT